MSNKNMSETDDRSKDAKKREYNRNAQRMFRQRRKEHIRNLERAERERITSQTNTIEQLRQENMELRRENEALSRFGSGCSSPSVLSVGQISNTSLGEPTSLMIMNEPVPNAHSHTQFSETPTTSVALSPRSSSSFDEAAGLSNRFCIVTPYDIKQARSHLHSLFHPVLNLAVGGTFPDPQVHFLALARLSPSLPPSLQPTALQLHIPHDVHIDMIPSPLLRDALLKSNPVMVAAFLADVCTFVCDIEDRGQVTIWGENFLNEISWEFSASVLEQWGGWFLPSIWRERADFWRRQRGDPLLASNWEEVVQSL
ncbi:hypothetical protein MferCBS49748_006695 [Microsporum ferrugineum]